MIFIDGEPPVPRIGAPGNFGQYFGRALCTEEVRTPKAKPTWHSFLIVFPDPCIQELCGP